MTRYDQPLHPAARFLKFIGLLLCLGVMIEGYNQVQGYFGGKATAAPILSSESKASVQP